MITVNRYIIFILQTIIDSRNETIQNKIKLFENFNCVHL